MRAIRAKIYYKDGKPTVNGRIYNFSEIFTEEVINKSYPVTISNEIIIEDDFNIKNIIGVTSNIQIMGDEVTFLINVIDENLSKVLNSNVLAGMVGFGEVKDNKIYNYNLIGFQIVSGDIMDAYYYKEGEHE